WPETYRYRVRSCNAFGCSVYVASSIVSPLPSPLAITTTTLEDAREGVPFSASLDATGGTADGYAWSVSAGALPLGLSLAANGTLSGTPQESGDFDFTVQVEDDGA